MVKQRISVDPPSDILDIRAHFKYANNSNFHDAVYAISDGGADSCILGKNTKVLSSIGRYAILVGYDPASTRKDRVPIVTAIIKVKSSSTGNHPVLLKVHEAPYNPTGPISLLSEYQIREYGLVIDSVAKKHCSSKDTYGTQLFQVNHWVHINFEDRGGLMGFELLPIEPDDEDKYDIITITSPEKWNPHQFTKHESNTPHFYDHSDWTNTDTKLVPANIDYPSSLSHLSLINNCVHDHDQPNDHNDDPFDAYVCPNDHFDMTDMTHPLIESHVLATST
jgi:hypothetical protein